MLLPLSGFSDWQLGLFGALYGLGWIAPVPPTIRLNADSFGAARGPLVFGWLFAGHQLGAAVAALGAGMLRDAMGTYTPAFVFGGALCLVAGGTALLLPRGGRLVFGSASATPAVMAEAASVAVPMAAE